LISYPNLPPGQSDRGFSCQVLDGGILNKPAPTYFDRTQLLCCEQFVNFCGSQPGEFLRFPNGYPNWPPNWMMFLPFVHLAPPLKANPRDWGRAIKMDGESIILQDVFFWSF
jgi:hypothetical protein